MVVVTKHLEEREYFYIFWRAEYIPYNWAVQLVAHQLHEPAKG